MLALTVFGWDLASEPHFMDESAYISQSFYADLWLQQKWDDPLWLVYAGYDLPPLPKYVIGLALRAEGHRRPGPSAMAAWYRDTSRQFVSLDALVAARRPSIVFGMIGCLAIYALGTLAFDRRVGLLSSLLLMANPLYAMHARRAMSDVMAESLLLATLAVGLWAWKRLLSGEGKSLVSHLALLAGSGWLCGLATLAKLNGALAGIILAVWAVLAILVSRPLSRSWRIVLATLGAAGVSLLTFITLNPFVFANPRFADVSLEPLARMNILERLKVISDHRVNVSKDAKSIFPDDALVSPLDKLKVLVVQGFGRFGPFGPRGRTDSTIRYDWRQDRGSLIWLPWVGLGFVLALLRGRHQFRDGEPATSWAIVVQASVALLIVTSFIPLAWDRYFLSIQPGSALLGAFAVIEVFDLIRCAMNTSPGTEKTT